ncbi:hypothetical protein MKW98_008589, partial [Papaver atlanticum]
MEKLQTQETAYFQKVERSRGCVSNRRTKDYLNNGIRLLVVFMVIVYTTKTTNALPHPSNPSVDFIILHNATELGAVCLDGSIPGYYFSKGFGYGSNNWLIHIE